MHISLGNKEREVYFYILDYKFKGTIRNKVFTLKKVLPSNVPLSCPKIELSTEYITKVIDKEVIMVLFERNVVRTKGIIYEN